MEGKDGRNTNQKVITIDKDSPKKSTQLITIIITIIYEG